ncbi:threonylcarbamoyl-AMP synthase [Rhodobacteraceae bacterium 2CG4]|uniref:Threonylcarbamoyl-AMP synthase n=1 Tax=Halovulum marinum TaxID=2662447 RepID=A0A6L5YY04_9RHOB|nr:L-threonylcarbamoyladenylate synthase [Halovulum marinum]MSU88564.1 threonylcarbamoyl-AMP synthase [Halovulum marinum]
MATPPSENTIRLGDTGRGLRAAAAMLRDGRLVAFPTETVYGLGADATDARAVAAIFAAKGRPRFNPLIVHVPDLAAAEALAEFDHDAQILADAFWPGPLTLVLPRRAGAPLADLVTAGLPSVALRVPAHPVARALLRAFGGPLAGPSANASGRISPTTADHVLHSLGGRIAGVIDAGPTGVGVESTIIGVTDGVPRLLRPGGLPAEAIEAALRRPLSPPVAAEGITAPGQLGSHYAPGVRLILDADVAVAGALWLAFGPLAGRRGLSLSDSRDLTEAAAHLFAHLHALDAEARAAGLDRVLVDPVPETGLGRAINDRLRRAAAPRPGEDRAKDG